MSTATYPNLIDAFTGGLVPGAPIPSIPNGPQNGSQTAPQVASVAKTAGLKKKNLAIVVGAVVILVVILVSAFIMMKKKKGKKEKENVKKVRFNDEEQDIDFAENIPLNIPPFPQQQQQTQPQMNPRDTQYTDIHRRDSRIIGPSSIGAEAFTGQVVTPQFRNPPPSDSQALPLAPPMVGQQQQQQQPIQTVPSIPLATPVAPPPSQMVQVQQQAPPPQQHPPPLSQQSNDPNLTKL